MRKRTRREIIALMREEVPKLEFYIAKMTEHMLYHVPITIPDFIDEVMRYLDLEVEITPETMEFKKKEKKASNQ